MMNQAEVPLSEYPQDRFCPLFHTQKTGSMI